MQIDPEKNEVTAKVAYSAVDPLLAAVGSTCPPPPMPLRVHRRREFGVRIWRGAGLSGEATYDSALNMLKGEEIRVSGCLGRQCSVEVDKDQIWCLPDWCKPTEDVPRAEEAHERDHGDLNHWVRVNLGEAAPLGHGCEISDLHCS